MEYNRMECLYATLGKFWARTDTQPENCSTLSPAQLLSFTSKGPEGRPGFGKVLVPVVLHVQVDLPSPGPLPQLQGNLTAREGRGREEGVTGRSRAGRTCEVT